jgi:hypothetical protein
MMGHFKRGNAMNPNLADPETMRAHAFLRANADDYRERFGYDRGTFQYIQAIKQLRTDLNLSLRVAKDAMDLWRDGGFQGAPMAFTNYVPAMNADRAKLLVQNLLLRGVPGITHLEKDAIRFLAS